MLKKVIILAVVFAVGFFGTKYVLKKMKSDKQVEMSIESRTIDKIPEIEGDWVTLFDGKSFNGWHQYLKDSVGSEWTIVDDAMVFTPAPNRDKGGSDIVTDKEFTNFVLSIDWKISEGGNSGIFWGVQESEEFVVPYLTGPEIQVLDNERHPDGKLENHRAGSLYDMIAPSQLVVKPAGEWNTCVLKVDHNTNTGKVWLNKVLIVEFPVHGEGWEALVQNSKFKNWKSFGIHQTGRIGLQDHADTVSFRNIKIKEL